MLESRTFKDGAIYLFVRTDYIKPTWFVRIKVPGVRGYISRSSRTTNEYEAYKFAEDLYNESLGKLHAGLNVNAKRISVGISEFIKHHEGTDLPSTSLNHTITLANRLLPSLRSKTFDQIDTQLVSEMLETISQTSRKGQLSPNTLKRTQSHLKVIMHWWVEHGYLDQLPVFPKTKTHKNRRPHFDKRDWNKLTRFMREFIKINHAPVRRDRTLLVNYVLILANTGIRVGEARNLKWRDIRPVENPNNSDKPSVALVVNGKTGMREAVARTGDVRTYFQRILDLRRSDLTNPKSDIFEQKDVPLDSYIFCGSNGKPIGSFKKSFNSLIDNAGVAVDSHGARRTIYSLRHTYATFRLQEGVNQYALARNMGTSVAMLEDFYGHTTNVGMVDELTKSRRRNGKTSGGSTRNQFNWLENS